MEKLQQQAIRLVGESALFDSEEAKKHWLEIVPVMTEVDLKKFVELLGEGVKLEKQRLAALKEKYMKAKDLLHRVDLYVREKREDDDRAAEKSVFENLEEELAKV